MATCCASPAPGATCSPSAPRAATCAWSIRRWTPSSWPRPHPEPPGGLLRHRLRNHRARQRDGRAAGAALGLHNFSCWSRRCACRRPCDAILSSPGQPRAGLSWPPATSAPSWAIGNIRRWPPSTACPSSSPASSRWTWCAASWPAVRQLEAGRAEAENAYAARRHLRAAICRRRK